MECGVSGPTRLRTVWRVGFKQAWTPPPPTVSARGGGEDNSLYTKPSQEYRSVFLFCFGKGSHEETGTAVRRNRNRGGAPVELGLARRAMSRRGPLFLWRRWSVGAQDSSVRDRQVRASGLDYFWFGAIFRLFLILGVTVTDVDHDAGRGLSSCMELILLSWVGGEKVGLIIGFENGNLLKTVNYDQISKSIIHPSDSQPLVLVTGGVWSLSRAAQGTMLGYTLDKMAVHHRAHKWQHTMDACLPNCMWKETSASRKRSITRRAEAGFKCRTLKVWSRGAHQSRTWTRLWCILRESIK